MILCAGRKLNEVFHMERIIANYECYAYEFRVREDTEIKSKESSKYLSTELIHANASLLDEVFDYEDFNFQLAKGKN